MSSARTKEIKLPRNIERVLYIDAEDTILGRLSSEIAKKLLEGYRVYVVNAEKAVISGDPLMVIKSYRIWWDLKVHVNPYKWSPKRPKNPVSIVRKAVQGMLPRSKQKGREAMKRLKVYIGVPEELQGKEFIKYEQFSVRKLHRKFIRVGELCKRLGWKGVLY